ncbi:peptidoglycan/xylan/chitin deacetylase (PgdA/CDA1 family) [Prosthecobacter fusiformis]|uniref:Peptidoglycan/xylan/chitin deacetylase (PgdA/CDA1 family) n=1 Tax=Prosthecobacter fusiformis TaxID=48464 RepID=A0A4R7S734_9BACT|nr:polysaccharide deacetylase family protein [Prosthecobacter fusiformis]TDU73275.1 peptidoglycan/xylan/chitin deacetylase (PgdA/CDA1 family) [Prosthecobacter fusiformis]
MYLSIWLGILMGSAGCSSTDKKKEDLAEVRKATLMEADPVILDNPLSKRLNNPSTMPTVPPAGAKISYSQVNITEKVVAMTFDDGPHPSLTPKLLDILKARNIKCTFFVIGKQTKMYPNIIRRMIAEGHEIANHTWTHASLTSRSDEQIRSELQQSEDALVEVANYRPHLIRPPYGAINARIKQLMFSEFGYSTIMWSVDPQDWRRPGVSVVTSRLVNGAHPGAIMLAHDIHPPTIEAMPAMFDQLLAKGYQFVTVSQLLNMEKANMPVGMVIRPAMAVDDADPAPLPQ